MSPNGTLWVDFFGRLVVESAVLMTLATAITRKLSAQQQRKIWQVALSALLILFVVEATGVHRKIRIPATEAKPIPLSRLVLEVKAGAEVVAPARASATVQSKGSWLPGIVWLAIFGWLVTRNYGSRLLFLTLRSRRHPLTDRTWQDKVDVLAARMSIAGRIRLTQSRLLAGPVAFGFFRRCICLPETFGRDFQECEQDAMLAHEVAHLAVRDPFWYAVVDLAAAVFWFNPLVWFGRKRFQGACECAADEASLLVPEGASTLAACLVRFGKRLAGVKSYGWIGIEGNAFRSGLARRVNRLLKLDGKAWRPLSGGWSALAQAMGLLAVASLLMLSAAHARSRGHSLGEHLWLLAFSAALQPLPPVTVDQALNTAPPQLIIEARFAEFRHPLETLFVRDYVLGGQDEGSNSFRGILTPSRYRELVKKLEEQDGADVLSAPKVTTLSGRQAQIKVVDVQYIVATADPANNRIDHAPPKVEPFEFGPVLDVVPSVRPDGVTIDLSMISTVREFAGYHKNPPHFDSATPKPLTPAPIRDYLGERDQNQVNPIRTGLQEIRPAPVFRLRQAQTSLRLWDGQTAVMALEVKQPPSSPSLRMKFEASGKTCLVFVTATLIDAAGNRLNREEKLPFVEWGIPE